MLKRRLITLALLAISFQSLTLKADDEMSPPVLQIPERPLAEGSLLVASPEKGYLEWSREDHSVAYQQLQAIATLWQKSGRSEKFFVYGRHGYNDTAPFSWEIVPFYSAHNRLTRFRQQLSVLWNIVFGGAALSDEERDLMFEFYSTALETTTVEPLESDSSSDELNSNPFCDESVIEKHWVLKGEKVQILYNFTPLFFSGKNPHFLVVPYAHRKNFRYMTEEEAVEASLLTQLLVKHFGETRSPHEVHIYHKNGGADVGQTIPHWHQHVLFIAEKNESTWGKLHLLKNMLVHPFTYSREEVSDVVELLREELKELKLEQEETEEELPVDEEEEELEGDENIDEDEEVDETPAEEEQEGEEESEDFPDEDLLDSVPDDDEIDDENEEPSEASA